MDPMQTPVWQAPAEQPLPQPPLPQPPQRSKWSAGKIVALVLSLCLVFMLAAGAVGYVAWSSHQKTLERERIATEKAAEAARLAEIKRNVELFRGDMQKFLDSPASSDTQGMKMSASGAVGNFEVFLNKQMTTYATALQDHDDALVSYHNTKISSSYLAGDDRNLSKSNAELAAIRSSSAEFYDTVGDLFSEQSLRDGLKTSDIPKATQDEMVTIALQFSTRYDAKLKEGQQTENSAWDAHQKFFDLLKAQYGNWKVSGSSVTWYNRSGYDQFNQLNADQLTLLQKALDTLWSAVNIKATRSVLAS